MKGLILKDFYMMKKQLRIYALVMGIYAILFVPQGMGDMLAFMSVLFCMMSIVTAMSFDETLKWDRYALTGPLTRRGLVQARYLWALLTMLAGFGVGALSYVLLRISGMEQRPILDSLAALFGGCLTALLALSVIIPCIYKLGAERARLLLIGSVMVPVGVIVLYSKYAPVGVKLWFVQYAHFLPPVLLLVTLAALVISYKISLRVYTHKDF